MNNQNGYSLIIVSFFATLLGLSGNLFMMNAELDRNAKINEHFEELTEGFRTEIRGLLSSYRQCTFNLENQIIDQDLHSRSPGNPPSLDYSYGMRLVWPMLEMTTKHGPVRFDRIQVLNMPDENGNLRDHLVITVNFNPENQAGFKSLNQRLVKIPLTTERNGNRIVSCMYDPDDFAVRRLQEQCEHPSVGGTYDPDRPFSCSVPPPQMDDGTFKSCGFNPVGIDEVAGRLEIVCGS